MRRHDTDDTSHLDGAGTSDPHLGLALILATVVASPVLLAALGGRQSTTSALTLYLVAIIGSWFAVGLVGGALRLVGSPSSADDEPDASPERRSDSVASAPQVGEPDPAASSR